MDSSSVVSFKIKGDSDPVFDEEQWQETVLIGDDGDKVQVNQDQENVKEDGLSSEGFHKTLSHFEDKVFEQMEKQQMGMEKMFQSVREEFDQYYHRLKMIKDEVYSEIKQEIDMTRKIAEIQIKKEIDSENVAPSELGLEENKIPGFLTSTPKSALGFQKNVKWNLDDQSKPFIEDKSFGGVTKDTIQADRKDQQCKEEKSLILAERSDQEPSDLEDPDSSKRQTSQCSSVLLPGVVRMKPQQYDGKDDWDEYVTQFDILSDINRWSYESKSLYLAGSLKGQARAILNELSPSERRDYDKLVKALSNRFGTTNRAEMYRARLQSKTRNRDESIPELAQTIRKLTRQAYPNASSNLLDVLALDHFVDALTDPDMRFRLREARPKSISEAEIIAVRIETHKLADRQRGKVFVRSLDVYEHNKKPMNKLSQRKWTPTSSKPGFGKYSHQVKQDENNVQSEMQELKRHFDELKCELKVCKEAFNDPHRVLLDRDETPIRKQGNVKTPNLGARIREEQAGPK